MIARVQIKWMALFLITWTTWECVPTTSTGTCEMKAVDLSKSFKKKAQAVSFEKELRREIFNWNIRRVVK